VQPETEKPLIRLVQALPRSGGTVLSRCLGVIANTVLLSQIHPQGYLHHNTLLQARDWYYLVTDEEIASLAQSVTTKTIFHDQIGLIYQRSVKQGSNLIVRDWCHLSLKTQMLAKFDLTVPFFLQGYCRFAEQVQGNDCFQ
jgi:hypothetical protein